MKYIDEFRDGEQARATSPRTSPPRCARTQSYNFMEFCGGHTHAISRYGIADLLPDNVRMIHGPGCPVCVLPIGRIDLAIRLALERGVMLCTYGDTMRVPASESLSLIKAKARGADMCAWSIRRRRAQAGRASTRSARWCSSPLALRPPRRPRPWCCAMRQARAVGNFSVLCCHVLTPVGHHAHSGIGRGAQLGTVPIDGFVGPAHVSIVIGSQPYEHFAEEYRKPVVITGLRAAGCDAGHFDAGAPGQRRAVPRSKTSFHVRSRVRAIWPRKTWCRRCSSCVRASSGAAWARCPTARSRFARPMPQWDAERKFDLQYASVPDHKQCECGAILRGRQAPARLQAVWHRVHAREPDGLVHGVQRRGLCGALLLWAIQGHSARPRYCRVAIKNSSDSGSNKLSMTESKKTTCVPSTSSTGTST
jgi:hydrogenase expression/formation protein HypD